MTNEHKLPRMPRIGGGRIARSLQTKRERKLYRRRQLVAKLLEAYFYSVDHRN